MTTPAVVMLEVVTEEPAQVSLAEDDEVLAALAADAPDHPLRVWILPGAPWGGEHFFDAMHFTRARKAGPYARSRSRIR